MSRIAFIGAGNMARAMAGPLLRAGEHEIVCSDPLVDQREALAGLGATTTEDNATAVRGAAAVVLAVKPQVLPDVAAGLAGVFAASRPLIVSIAAGVPMRVLEACCGPELAIVRCMPNTPALIGRGITALYPNTRVDATQRHLADTILGAAGETLWVDEEGVLDTVTALSGSGPAYVFALIEAMEEAGCDLGLRREMARRLALATVAGAGELALRDGESPSTLRERVTSPGGTTAAALAVFAERGFAETVRTAIHAAARRSTELGNEAAAATLQSTRNTDT